MTELTDADRALCKRARDTCERAFDPAGFDGESAHIVASALRTDDGMVYDGVSLPASVGRASVCAEPVAVGEAVADGVDRAAFDTIVAVAHPRPGGGHDDVVAIPPCGVCRELLVDYQPELRVIVPEGEEGGPLTVARAENLLPNRTW
jgi:cytidine deaminase